MQSLSLDGRVVLVTGASRGIGKAIAFESACAGADIVVTYGQQREKAEEVATRIRELGQRALVTQVDVSSRTSVRNTVCLALEVFGRIDVLVNNAGILQQKSFLEISDKDWDRIINVNLKGTFLCAQEVFPVMQRQGGGRIINIGSTGGQLGGRLAVHYSASKAGVICLTKSLARIGAPYGILVNCIAPGLIDTEMTRGEIDSEAGREKIRRIPLQRPGTAEEIAELAVFLASDMAAYITGQTINVDGGLYMA